MSGPYEEYPGFYNKKQRNQVFEWEFPRHARISLPLSMDGEHHEQLILDSEDRRRVSRPVRGPSRPALLSFNLGAWMVKVGCRLERLGVGRIGAQPAGSALSVDCGCS